MLEQAVKEFFEYAGSYLSDDPRYQMKYDHTERVFGLCRQIAQALFLPKEDVELAMLCGLLHDVARFEQLKQYGTFTDSRSIDHGDFGVEILMKDHFIREFYSDESLDLIVLNSVKYHNKLEVPEDLDERSRLFLNITRDADKIDILYLATTPELHLQMDGNFMNDTVYQTLLSNRMVNKKDTITREDGLGLWLGFVFDFNYSDSVAIVREHHYVDLIIERYLKESTHPKMQEQLITLQKHLNDYLERE